MTNEEAQELAKKHWDFIEKLILVCGVAEESLPLIEYLYREAMIHGIKHGEASLPKK